MQEPPIPMRTKQVRVVLELESDWFQSLQTFRWFQVVQNVQSVQPPGSSPGSVQAVQIGRFTELVLDLAIYRGVESIV